MTELPDEPYAEQTEGDEQIEEDIPLSVPFEISRGLGHRVRNLQYQRFDKSKHESQTASTLAYTFAWMLGLALLLHYLTLTGFLIVSLYSGNPCGVNPGIKILQETYNIWFPALIGIVSAVTTYYFTCERK